MRWLLPILDWTLLLSSGGSWPFTLPVTSNFHRSTFVPHAPCFVEPRFPADASLLFWVQPIGFPPALPCGYARGAGCWAQALSPNALFASRSRFLGSALNQNGRSMGRPKSRHTFCFERCYTWSTSVEPSCKLLSVLPRTRLGAVTSRVVMQARHQTTSSPPT